MMLVCGSPIHVPYHKNRVIYNSLQLDLSLLSSLCKFVLSSFLQAYLIIFLCVMDLYHGFFVCNGGISWVGCVMGLDRGVFGLHCIPLSPIFPHCAKNFGNRFSGMFSIEWQKTKTLFGLQPQTCSLKLGRTNRKGSIESSRT